MKILLPKMIKCLYILTAIIAFSSYYSAQTQPAKLVLNNPIESEIKGGGVQNYLVSLNAGQLARVEVVQNGIEIALAAYDPKGELFIITESPTGMFGDDLILVTAKETGEYKIAVEVPDPRSELGKYTIVLKEVRLSNPEDFKINEAAQKITKVGEEAYAAKYKGTLEGRQEALSKWRQIIELSKIKKDKAWEGIAFQSMGLIYEQLGELQNALDVYLQSLELLREAKSRQYEASSINNIGAIYMKLGEYEKAISYYDRATIIQREIGNRKSIGIYLNNLGNAYKNLENYKQAVDYFKQSLEIKKEDESIRGKRSLANTINNLGDVLILQGEFESGIDYLKKALELRREVEHSWGIANSLLNLGNAQWQAGEKQESYKNLKSANFISNEVGDRQMQARSFYLLAVAENNFGNNTQAIENISNGLELIEQIRGELVSSEIRYAYFSTVQDYYELYTELLFSRYEKSNNKDDLALALQISERSRSRSLIELLQEAKVNFKQGIDTKLLEELKKLQSEISEKYTSRQNILSGKPKADQVTKINNEINELNTAIQNLKFKIRRSNPKYADLTEGKTVSANEIQLMLDDETVLLEYKLGKKRSFVWFVSKDSIKVHELADRETIEKYARQFYDLTIANDRNQTEQKSNLSKQLSEMLFSKIAKEIKGKRLAIVSDGMLQYLPFSALVSPESGVQSPKFAENEVRLLVETNEIVILPSASVLAQLRANPNREKTNGKTIAIFADPVFDLEDSRIAKNSNIKPNDEYAAITKVLRDFRLGETLPRLLASRQEARSISNLVDNNESIIRTDFEANLENIENSNLKDYRILHFATHGLLNSNRPELSGLVFSLYDKNGKKQAGFLSLNDIYNLDLSSDLIVLSACQTALGKDVRGEGLIGMSRGFLYAGSNRIIASLWKVDDSATAEFMKRFYGNHLQKGMSASKALQQTKIEMKNIKRYNSPYYWSAFTLLGDWQ
jgi:CHAT domain-containing protein/Tfp pilus assembly protein PilF